jgi:esterase/lipase
MQGLINYFYDTGHNVVAPLLAGHWQSDAEAFYKITHKAWQTQMQEILNLSVPLGNEIILVGHSTGGLLAIDLLMKNKHLNISHLVLFSPALKLRQHVKIASKIGGFFKLTQNLLSLKNKPCISSTEYDLHIRPAVAGTYVDNLINDVFGKNKRLNVYNNINIPTLIFSTESDLTVSHEEIVNLSVANKEFIKLISYKKTDVVKHDTIHRSVIDVEPNSPTHWVNPYFQNQLTEISNFIF